MSYQNHAQPGLKLRPARTALERKNSLSINHSFFTGRVSYSGPDKYAAGNSQRHLFYELR